MAEFLEDIGHEGVAQVAIDGEEDVEGHQADQGSAEVTEQLGAGGAVHGFTTGAIEDVAFVRGWQVGEEIEADGHGWDEEGGGDGGHPEFADVPGMDDPAAGGFDPAGGEDEGDGEAEAEEFGDSAAFQKAEDESPDHAEGEAIEEEADQGEGWGEGGQHEQSDPGDAVEADDEGDAGAGFGFGDDFDAGEFGQGVPDHLGDDEEDLEVEAPELEIGEGGGGEGPTEGVHAGVRAESGGGGDEGEGDGTPLEPEGEPVGVDGMHAMAPGAGARERSGYSPGDDKP